MSENRFNLIMALYVFCMDYHSGQSSRGYRILFRIQSRYKTVRLNDASIRAIQGHSDRYIEAHSVYCDLVRNYASKVAARTAAKKAKVMAEERT